MKKIKLTNTRVRKIDLLTTPRELKDTCRLTSAAAQTVERGREEIVRILKGRSRKFLAVVGPCSIHEAGGAFDYAERLSELAQRYTDELVIVMRTYFEKPRTTTGWQGLIVDPHLDGSNNMSQGLMMARQILVRINAMGLPTATEFLDPLVPQYIDDLVSWAAVGARTTESQTHRRMASGLAMPVGFKNGTDGSTSIALDAMEAAQGPHSFLGVDEHGRSAVVHTTGNPWGHVVLRGGNGRTNYDVATLREVTTQLMTRRLPTKILVDCSHGNSHKNHEEQGKAWDAVTGEFIRHPGQTGLVGAMLESNLFPKKQPLPNDLTGFDTATLIYGVSVTDACIGWNATERMLGEFHRELTRRKK